jgi:hypothetical protein
MANLKFQNMESAICDLKFRVLARTRSRLAPGSLFDCGIRDNYHYATDLGWRKRPKVVKIILSTNL